MAKDGFESIRKGIAKFSKDLQKEAGKVVTRTYLAMFANPDARASFYMKVYGLPADVAEVLAIREVVLPQAEDYVAKAGPDALRHFRLFTGGLPPGQTISVPLRRIFTEDSSFKEWVYKTTTDSLRKISSQDKKMYTGTVPVNANNYSKQNQNWYNAIGAVTIKWCSDVVMQERRVLYEFHDVYDWHPHDTDRPSQPFHAWMKKLVGRRESHLVDEGLTSIPAEKGKTAADVQTRKGRIVYLTNPVCEYPMRGELYVVKANEVTGGGGFGKPALLIGG